MKNITKVLFKVIISISTGMMSLGSAAAQDAVLQQLNNKFDAFSEAALQEKLYVHTDQPSYLAGEILWFKIYCVDGISHQPLDLSKVAYLELIDSQQQPVLQAKVALDDGKGDGSFYLPVSIKTGQYTLRAYTNWMKNFGEDAFFEQPVVVVNSFSSGSALPTSKKEKETAPDIQFFPEGGQLVNGIESKVGFKVVAASGKGVDFQGVVLNTSGDTILTFRPLKFGMGNFSFTPKSGETYRAVVAVEGKTYRADLPQPEQEGIVMKLSKLDDDNVRITLQASKNWPSRFAYLLVHTQQKRLASAALQLVEGKAFYEVETASLSAGISHFTVFDERLNPLLERLFFIPPENQLEIEAKPDKSSYQTRQAIEVTLEAPAAMKKDGCADLSLAVYRITDLPTEEVADIHSELWLGSELKGFIESPAYYFSGTDEGQQASENLMLTQGWRVFDWPNILAEEHAAFQYIPEYEGHIIRTKIKTVTGEQPHRWILGYIALPGRYPEFYGSNSVDRETMQFVTKNLYGNRTLILQANTANDSLHRFEIVEPYFPKYATKASRPIRLTPELAPAILQRSIAMQVQNVYKDSLLHQFTQWRTDTLPFFGVPDRIYRLDDYTRFPTMEEVMREYVPEVAVRKSKGEFHYRVFDKAGEEFMDEDPLVLLDGIPVFDIDRIIQTDPFKIEKLEVKARKYVLNKTVFFGVVSYQTYDGNAKAWFEPDEKALVTAYKGLQEKRKFYAPKYDTAEKRTSRSPDFRQLLHWAPSLKLVGQDGSTKVSFYTSDQEGTYLGVVQGLNADGSAGSSSFTFEVTEGVSN